MINFLIDLSNQFTTVVGYVIIDDYVILNINQKLIRKSIDSLIKKCQKRVLIMICIVGLNLIIFNHFQQAPLIIIKSIKILLLCHKKFLNKFFIYHKIDTKRIE